MIAIENKGFGQNLAYTIVDENNKSVDAKTFCNNRKNGYLFSYDGIANVFENLADAEKMAKKTFRKSTIKKVVFENTEVQNAYGGIGANITGFDFQNSRLLIECKTDLNKYGYDYRNLILVN